MVKNDLIERYVYAVTKYMKADLKKDVSAELETIIQDMLEERCGDVMPTEHDIRVVLTELGTPAELASKYKSETQDCLIGQPYYNLYVYVLKIVTACVIGGMLLAQIMAAVISHTIWYIAIFRIIGGIFGGVLTGFAFVTLLFAFFYKRGIKVEGLSNMKIGIFDSGIGGLSVLHQAMIIMPEADYIFYADVDNVPYGEKTKEEVRKLVDHAVGFLVDKGCQAIVLACNTATSAAISYLREKYKLPIIGIEPAVKPAVEHIHESGKRVMVVSTPVTAKGEKLKKLVDKYDNKHIVDVVALPKLVRFAQDDDFDSSDVTDYLKSEFAPYNLNDYSELVLGCTHFNYFKDSFSKLFPDDLEMVDGNTGVSNNLKNTVVKKGIFKEEDKGKKGTVEYYYSDRKMESEAEMKHIKKLHERLERMRQI